MNAKYLGLVYEAGDFYISQSVKLGTKTTYNSGYIYTPKKSGYSENYRPSHLILYLDVNGHKTHCLIDRFFKDNIGPLTEKRRKKIKGTMSLTVKVEKVLSQNGEAHYVVSEKDLCK